MSSRSRRSGLLALLLIGQFAIVNTATAALPAWCEFFLGKRDTPFLTPNEKIYRRMLAERRKDPNYRPSWKVYEENRTSGQDLITDPGYFWFPGNIWNDLLEENYPSVAHDAREYHREREVNVPDVTQLPDASLVDVPGYFPDPVQPHSVTSDDSLTSSPTFEPHHSAPVAKDANSGFFDMFSSPPASSSHHHHDPGASSPGASVPADDSSISSPAPTAGESSGHSHSTSHDHSHAAAPSSDPSPSSYSSPTDSGSGSTSTSTDSGSSSSTSSSTDSSSSSSSSSSDSSSSSSSSSSDASSGG